MNGTKFYDIYDYIYVPFWKTTTFVIILATVLTIICTICLYFLVKRARNKSRITPAITPGEWALGELKKLTPQKYQTKEEFKLFYFELTRITKEYLEKQFSIDVVEKTDEELIAHLQAHNFPQNFIQKLETVLRGSLLIKFANAQALREQAQNDLKTVIFLIKTGFSSNL